MSNYTNNVAVIIRSAHERTEALCVELIKQQIPEKNIVLLHERPFSQALRKSFEVGLDYGLDWTLCVDADLLVRPNKVQWLTHAMAQYPSVFGGHGRIIDKFYGHSRFAGPHIYHTHLLKEAIKHIPDESITIRPETYVKDIMKQKGHDWKQFKHVIAVHDFEQFYTDVYRTMIVRARRSPSRIAKFLEDADRLAEHDKDFLVMGWALRIAISRDDVIKLDSEQWREEFDFLSVAHGLSEKQPIDIIKSLSLPGKIIKKHWLTVPYRYSRRVYKRLKRKITQYFHLSL